MITEYEANRYMNDVIYHQLVDWIANAFRGGAVTPGDVLSAVDVAYELYLRLLAECGTRCEVQSRLNALGVDVSSAVSRVLRAVDAAKDRQK